MIVCNRCSKENQDHYKFCLGCGAELTSPVKPGQDIGAMKTMMADASSLAAPPPRPSGPTPAPYGNLPMPGAPMGPPGPMGGPMGPSGHMPGPMGGPMGPPGPMGGPMGGVPMTPAAMPPGMGQNFHQPPPAGFQGGPLGPPPMGGPPMGPPPGPMTNPMGAQGPGPMPMGPPPGVPALAYGAPPSAPMPAAGPKRCPQCSTDVPPGFRFCGACGFRMDEVSAAAPMPQAPPVQPMAPPQPRATLTLIRPDGSEGGVFELKQGDNKIGRTIAPIFENDGYLSPTHAELTVGAASGLVKDVGSLNGVFIKLTEEEEIRPGQVFRIGQELLRFDLVTPPEPTPDGTEVMGSPNPGYWGKITVIIGKDVDGSAYPLLGESVTIGRERGEINFPDDGYVSGLHAKVTTRDGRVYLADLGSSNGTFFKIAGERALRNESFVLLGQQLFRLNL